MENKRKRESDSHSPLSASNHRKVKPTESKNVLLDPTYKPSIDLFLKATLPTKDVFIPEPIFTLEMLKNSVNSKGYSKAVELKKNMFKYFENNKAPFQLGRVDFKDVFDTEVLIRISKVQFLISTVK